MKGYKAFNNNWTCRGFQYKIGETYELEDGKAPVMCARGFHFCKNPIDVFGYYPFDGGTRIAEVEALGDILQEGTKYCTNRIKIVREFTMEQLRTLIHDGRCNTGKDNTGDYNSGYQNSGNYNSGNWNSGNYNSGYRNSGYQNSGNWNSGYRNSGYQNSGNWNSGNWNSGNRNSGNWNSGNWNSGYRNSGYQNSGNWNSGNYNSGDGNSGNRNSGNYNSGDGNSGNWNSGIFNTNEPKMRAFNKDSNVSRTEFLNSLDYDFNDLCDRIFKKQLVKGDEERIKALPNFDADIFEEITGIRIGGNE